MKGVLTLFLALALLSVAATGTAAAADDPCMPSGDEPTNESVTTPGQQLAGVVGAQQSKVADQIDGRGLDAKLSNASTTEERAAVIAAEVERIEERTVDLEDRCLELTEKRENGTFDEGQYQTRVETFEARTDALACHANRTAERAEPLPADVRDEYGINDTTFAAIDERIEVLQEFAAAESGDDEPAAEFAAYMTGSELQEEPDECTLEAVDDHE